MNDTATPDRLDITVDAPSLSECARLLDWLASGASSPIVGAQILLEASPDASVVVARLGPERVGIALIRRLAPVLTCIGPIAIKPDWRGRGFGRRVWNAALAAAGHGALVTTVPSRFAPRWMRDGFRHEGDEIRLKVIAAQQHEIPSDIRLAYKAHVHLLAQYDRLTSRVPRLHMIRSMLANDASRVLVSSDGHALHAWGAVHVTRSGFRIAPMIANGEIQAARLLDALCAIAGPGQQIDLYAPKRNAVAIDLAAERGFVPCETLARLVRGDSPAALTHREFATAHFIGY